MLLALVRRMALIIQLLVLVRRITLGMAAAKFCPRDSGLRGCAGARFHFADPAEIDDFAHFRATPRPETGLTARRVAAAVMMGLIGDAGVAGAIGSRARHFLGAAIAEISLRRIAHWPAAH